MRGSEIVARWPAESRAIAQLVIDGCGEPDSATESRLTWYEDEPWRRIVVSRGIGANRMLPRSMRDTVPALN